MKSMRTFLRPWLLGLLLPVAVGACDADAEMTSAADGDTSTDITVERTPDAVITSERDSEIAYATDETGKVVKVVRLTRPSDYLTVSVNGESVQRIRIPRPSSVEEYRDWLSRFSPGLAALLTEIESDPELMREVLANEGDAEAVHDILVRRFGEDVFDDLAESLAERSER